MEAIERATRPPLIPEAALKRCPKAVKDAQAKAAKALVALGKGRERATEARAGVRAAHKADAEAVARAARGQAEAKPPTEPVAKAELKAAERGCKILSGDATRAIRTLHEAVLEHRRELIDRQAAAIEAAQARASELLVELGDTLDGLAGEHAVLIAYRRADDFREGIVRGRQHTQLGRLNFEKRREPPSLRQSLAALRVLVDDYAPVSEGVGERKEREQAEAEERSKRNRAWREMGTAAVVPSDVTQGR